MKKLIVNLSDSTFEKIRFEAIEKQKSLQEVISERLLSTPFSSEAEEAYNKLWDSEFTRLLGD